MLQRLMEQHKLPRTIRVDNGPGSHRNVWTGGPRVARCDSGQRLEATKSARGRSG